MEIFFLLLTICSAISGIIVGIVGLIKKSTKSKYISLLIIVILGAVAFTSNKLMNVESNKISTTKKSKIAGELVVKFFTPDDNTIRFLENISKDTTYVYSGGKTFHYKEIIFVD